jgi:hypothetical protein
MLYKQSENVRYCYERARECLRRAKQSKLPEQREAFVQIARHWMNLARSYEFTEQLTDFTSEQQGRLNATRYH